MPRRIDRAEFVISAVSERDLPRDGRPEVAMIGRSNVGKSTLINALVRKEIARTSSTPGRTRQVNVYRIAAGEGGADSFYLMDLPGYGHASGGPKAREEFAAIIGSYFQARTEGADGGTSPLAGCVLAIDARHPGLASDVDALRWLSTLRVPSIIAATKADKLTQSDKARLRKQCEQTFGQAPLIVSATKGDGLDELWRKVREWTAL
jgi:GTP-binding protein